MKPHRREGFDQRPRNGEADETAEEPEDEGHRPVQPITRLLHGAINLSQGIFLGGVDGASRYWLLCIVYGVAAVIVAVVLGLTVLRKRAVSAPAPVEATDV